MTRPPSSRRGRSGTGGRRERPTEPPEPRRRTVDKSRTRRALLDGALELLEDRTLDHLSIREVTRAAGVAPAAFYRHFDRIDDLGLVLVDEAFATLRLLMRGARDREQDPQGMIHGSVAALARHVEANPAAYRFIAREQFSPVRAVHLAIRREIKLFAAELATDLARLPVVRDWPTADLVMLADLVVALMVDTAQRLLEAVDEGPERRDAVLHDAERRLRYLAVAAPAWHPDRSAP